MTSLKAICRIKPGGSSWRIQLTGSDPSQVSSSRNDNGLNTPGSIVAASPKTASSHHCNILIDWPCLTKRTDYDFVLLHIVVQCCEPFPCALYLVVN